jgi:predicted RNA-binding protein YlxR (DUF448 family)/ribosomal protein L7Ae-like RNA K-turn-binding protein
MQQPGPAIDTFADVAAAAHAADDARRRCIASGESFAPEEMLRFVIGPDDSVVPDLARRLPGRGIWVRAERAAVERAVTRNLFSRAARRTVRADADLPERVGHLLLERALDLVGLARRAGRAVAGMAKVEERVRRGRVGLLLVAGDAGSDGRRRLHDVPAVELADAATLGAIFGRDQAVYVAIEREVAGGGMAQRIAAAVSRWQHYVGAAPRSGDD